MEISGDFDIFKCNLKITTTFFLNNKSAGVGWPWGPRAVAAALHTVGWPFTLNPNPNPTNTNHKLCKSLCIRIERKIRSK